MQTRFFCNIFICNVNYSLFTHAVDSYKTEIFLGYIKITFTRELIFTDIRIISSVLNNNNKILKRREKLFRRVNFQFVNPEVFSYKHNIS